MNNKIRKLLSAATLILLVALAVYYLKNNISDFKQLTIANPSLILVLIALFLFGYYLISIITKNLLYPLGVYLKTIEAFQLSVVTGFYNLITPFRGGMAARAVYLKRKYKFPYTDFLASLSASYVLIFLVASLLGLASAIWLFLENGVMNWILLSVFAVVFAGMFGIVLLSPKFKERKSKWLNRFIKVINGWHLIKNNKRVIFLTSIVTLVQILLSTLMLYLQFLTFGIEISFASALFLSAIGSLSLLVAITPGNLGVGEAITVFSALAIGITPAQSLSAALLGRAVSMAVLFVLGPIFSYALMKKK